MRAYLKKTNKIVSIITINYVLKKVTYKNNLKDNEVKITSIESLEFIDDIEDINNSLNETQEKEIHIGDTILVLEKDGKERPFVVKKIDKENIEFSHYYKNPTEFEKNSNSFSYKKKEVSFRIDLSWQDRVDFIKMKPTSPKYYLQKSEIINKETGEYITTIEKYFGYVGSLNKKKYYIGDYNTNKTISDKIFEGIEEGKYIVLNPFEKRIKLNIENNIYYIQKDLITSLVKKTLKL